MMKRFRMFRRSFLSFLMLTAISVTCVSLSSCGNGLARESDTTFAKYGWHFDTFGGCMVLVNQQNGVMFPSGEVQPPDWCIARVEPTNKPNEYIFKVIQRGSNATKDYRMTGVDDYGRPVMVEIP